jgi:hypothetical protein
MNKKTERTTKRQRRARRRKPKSTNGRIGPRNFCPRDIIITIIG